MAWAAKRPGAAMVASMPIMALTEWPTTTTGPVANSSTTSSRSSAWPCSDAYLARS